MTECCYGIIANKHGFPMPLHLLGPMGSVGNPSLKGVKLWSFQVAFFNISLRATFPLRSNVGVPVKILVKNVA